jgi:hypothetical protein
MPLGKKIRISKILGIGKGWKLEKILLNVSAIICNCILNIIHRQNEKMNQKIALIFCPVLPQTDYNVIKVKTCV